jgi:hypothetical protein
MQRSNRGVRMGQVHKLIDQQGRQLAGGQIPGRRADRIALAASSTMSDEHMGEISTVIYSGWCHAGLPHRKTADEQDWRIVTEHLTLGSVRNSVLGESAGTPVFWADNRG